MRSLPILLLAIAACETNVSGNLAASKHGDTSHPAERGSPVRALREACGDGQITSAARGVITRAPYLQQVSATAAQIGWVTSGQTAERVELATPTGSAIGAITAAPETEPRVGSLQQWSALETLEPGTIYCYGVANGTELATRTGFRTAPAADSTEPVRFIAFGDSGTGGRDQLALRSWMYEFPFDLVVHTGDMAYDSGTLEQFERNVFGVYGDLMKNIPFFPSPGNHDYGTAGGEPYRQVFALPNGERYYSFDWGRVHFVALDTQHDFAEQARWLDQDLAATTRPWKIVYMHKPAFSSGPHGDNADVRAFFVPLFEKHGVQLVLAGHDHNYERIEPQHGVAYVVTGGGGAGTRIVGHSSFTAFSEEVIHFVYVEVAGDELVLHAIDGTGVEFDSMVVPRTAL